MLINDTFNIVDIQNNAVNPGLWVVSDMNACYEVFAKIGENIFAKSHRTGQIIRVVQTGQVLRDGWFRARFEFAQHMEGDGWWGYIGFTKDNKVGGNMGLALTKI